MRIDVKLKMANSKSAQPAHDRNRLQTETVLDSKKYANLMHRIVEASHWYHAMLATTLNSDRPPEWQHV